MVHTIPDEVPVEIYKMYANNSDVGQKMLLFCMHPKTQSSF